MIQCSVSHRNCIIYIYIYISCIYFRSMVSSTSLWCCRYWSSGQGCKVLPAQYLHIIKLIGKIVYVSGQPFKAVHSQILKNNKTIWSHCSWAPFVGSFSTHSRQCNLKPMSLTNFSLAMMKSITLIGCCRSSDYFLTNYAALFQHSIAMLQCYTATMLQCYTAMLH